MIAALYVDGRGCYANLPEVDVWDMGRDARRYAGPHPVVCHSPCQRWGRMAEGGPSAQGTRVVGDDGGCFSMALRAVRLWGGVLEHPCDSKAWEWFGIEKPKRHAGWLLADAGNPAGGGWTCYVEQGLYGHPISRKPSWLYYVGSERPPELQWGKGDQRLPEWMVERYGYKKASRIGVMAMVGGKDKTRIREATPPPFRDVLLEIARASATLAAKCG